MSFNFSALFRVFAPIVVSITFAWGADLRADERQNLLKELSQILVENPEPVQSELGWKGVLLVPAGTSIPAYTTNFEALGSRLSNNTQILADSYLFDRPLDVRNGIAFPKRRRISEVWEDVLRSAMPPSSPMVDQIIADNKEVAKWLFRIPDKVDFSRRTVPVREPSEYYLRYREYQLLYRLLLSSKSEIESDEESWKLHPRLAKYANAKDAEAGLLDDWQKYGYKIEVESAQSFLGTSTNSEQWANWSKAAEVYEASRVILDRSLRIPRTTLSPSPSEWLRMGTWQRASVPTEDGTNQVDFEYARIKVIREWFGIEMLFDNRLKLNGLSKLNISNGDTPTLLKYPVGDLSVYVDELILSRNIKYTDGMSGRNHPLTAFVSPQEIQIIAFVVCALPKVD